MEHSTPGSSALPPLHPLLVFFLPPGKAIRNPNITINAQSILALSRGHRHTPYQGRTHSQNPETRQAGREWT